MLNSPDVRMTRERAEEALEELRLMYRVTNHIGTLITLSSLKEEVNREIETGRLTLLKIEAAIRRYYDSKGKRKHKRSLVLGHEKKDRR